MKTARVSAALVITVFLLIGCMGAQAPDTPEKAYTVVRIEFNKTLTSYLIEKSKQSDEVHADWTKNVDPVIRDAETALDVWGMALDVKNMDLAMESEQDFLNAKNKLLDLLAERGM